MPVQRPRLASMLLVLPLLALTPAPARADVDVGAAALQTRVLQNDIDNFKAVAMQIVGPYTLNYKHTVTKTTSAGGHDYQSHKTYTCATTVSFATTQTGLVNAVTGVPDGISALESATADLTTWSGLVPGVSAQFNALVAQETELKASSQTAPVSVEDKDTFDASLTQARKLIVDSTVYLQTSLQSMVLFIGQSSDYQNAVSAAIATASASAIPNLNAASDSIKKQGCPNGLGGDYARIQGDIDGWIDRLRQAEATSAADSGTAQQSAADLAAFAIASQENLRSIQDELESAGTQDPGSFIQRLDLSVAQGQWNAIAAAVTK